MINFELKKRIFTSIILISLLILMYFYTYIMFVILIIFPLIAWIELYGLISKIYKKKKFEKQSLIIFF